MGARAASVIAVTAVLVMGFGAPGGGARAAERAIGPDPVTAKWPAWPFPATCSRVPFDPVAAFAGETGAEHGRRPSERALGRYLRRTKWVGDYVPLRDWRLLVESPTEATFASGRLSGGFGPSVMSFERKGDRWTWRGLSSSCRPTSVIDGVTAVSWTLDLRRPLPAPEATRIWIRLGPGDCSSGRSQNERARAPVVWQIDRKLMIGMTLEPLPPGGYTCEGLIEPSMPIDLPQPLGDLRLFDGATYPPVDVVRKWRIARREIQRSARLRQ